MRPLPLSPRERALLNTEFDESDIPFKVDVLEWERLTPSFRQRLMEGGAPVLCGQKVRAGLDGHAQGGPHAPSAASVGDRRGEKSPPSERPGHLSR
jgi:hypothetical protein